MRARSKLTVARALTIALGATLVCGVASAASSVAHTSAPKPVTKLKAAETSSTVTLDWSNPKSGTFSGLVIRRLTGTKAPATEKAGTLVAKLSAKKTSHVDGTVEASTTYSYSLFAAEGTTYSKATSITVTTSAAPLKGPHYIDNEDGGYDFSGPFLMTYDGTNLWVANLNRPQNESLVELNASTGDFVKSYSGYAGPRALYYYGGNLWIADGGGIKIVSAATGTLVKDLDGTQYDFDNPSAITEVDGAIWVANSDSNTSGSLTEINVTTFAFVKNLDSPAADFDGPSTILAVGSDVWTYNYGNGSLTEVNGATGSDNGAIIRNVTGIGTDGTASMVYADGKIWMTGPFGDAGLYSSGGVIEINPATGATVATLGAGYGFDDPDGIAAAGTDIWVANGGVPNASNGTSVSEFSGTTTDFIQSLTNADDSNYGFDVPAVLLFDGTNMWCVNELGNSMTEFPVG